MHSSKYQRFAHRSTFIAMGLLLLFFVIAAVGDWGGMIGLALGLMLYFVALLHIPLGIIAIIAAAKTGRHRQNSWIYGYFGLFAVTGLAYTGVINHWGDLLSGVYEQVTESETVVLREASDGKGSDLKRAIEAIKAGANVETRDSHDRTPLMLAAKNATLELVQQLLKASAKVNARTKLGSTALHYAASGGTHRFTNARTYNLNHDVVTTLLEAGAGVDEKTVEGLTPLMGACAIGVVAVAEVLIDRGAQPGARTNQDKTCLLFALENDRGEFLHWLINKYGPQLDLGSALAHAIHRDKAEMFAMLMRLGISPAALKRKPRSLAYRLADDRRGDPAMRQVLIASGRAAEAFADGGYVELSSAVSGGSVQTVKNLLAMGIDPNVRSSRGDAITHFIARRPGLHSEAKLRLLLAAGTAVDATDAKGSTPLFQAARNGNLEVMQLFIEFGADVNFTNGKGVTVLLAAARRGYGYIIEALEKAGVELPQAREHGDYLIAAREYGTSMRALLALGLDPNTRDSRGIYPLFDTIKYGDPDAVQALIEAGANLTHHDQSRYSPLTAAADSSSEASITALLAAGVDPETPDAKGRTALALAVSRRNIPAIIALLKGGATLAQSQRESITKRMLSEKFRGPGYKRKDELRTLLSSL